jgi:hypothetical protein
MYMFSHYILIFAYIYIKLILKLFRGDYMNNKSNNYRVMKFLEPVNKKDKCKGYVRLDIRGQRGLIIVSVENIGDNKSTSDIFLYKDQKEKIKLGTVNNRKGMIKKTITFGPNTNIDDYNVCGVVKDKKIVLYSNLFNKVDVNDVRKLEETVTSLEEVNKTDEAVQGKNEIEEESNDIIDSEKAAGEKAEEKKIKAGTEVLKDKPEEVKGAPESSESMDGEELEADEDLEYEEKTEVADNGEIDGDELGNDVESASRKNKYINKFEQRLYNTLGDANKTEPLSVKIKNLTWWKIPYDDKGARSGILPFYSQIISSYYPFPMANRVITCHNLIKKYKHYIFGVYKENDNITRFVYGVPGEFKREEQPYKGVTGFKNWSYKNKDIDGNFGYWIVFVNATTGEVTEPPQTIK